MYIKDIFLNIEVYSLFNSAIHLKNFILEEPRVSLVLDKDKKINFASIAKTKEAEVSEDANSTMKTPRIILDRIAVVNGSMNYEDYSRGNKFELSLDTIGFELKNIDTNDLNSSNANIRFYTLLSDGGFIDFKSEVIGFEPLAVKGSIDFEASKLYTQWRYIEDDLNLEVADGKLSLNAQYYVNLDDLQATTISNLNVNLDKLRVKPKGNYKDVLTLNSLYLENATIKPLIQDVHVKKIGLHSLDVSAARDAKGNIDWLEYTKINTKVQPKEEAPAKKAIQESDKDANPWNVLVDAIALEKIKVNFNDYGIKPSVKNTLNEVNIFAQNVSLAGEDPFSYQMNLTLNNQFKCSSQGSVIHKVLDLSSSMKCSELDVTHFIPYIDDIARKELKVYNVKLRSLMAGFDANVTAKDTNSSIVIDVSDANIYLNAFALNKRSTNKRLVTFSDFYMSGIKLNTATKDVKISDTTMKYLNLRTARLADGSLSLENLVVPKEVKKVKSIKKAKVSTAEKKYRVHLDKVAIKGAKISFVDKMLDPSVVSKIDGIYFSAYGVDSKKYSWMNYYLSARVNGSGKVKANGALRHTPLRQKGTLEVNKLALKDLNPYIDEHAFVYLKDGYLSLKTKLKYSPSAKNPDLSVDGSFKLDEFFVHDSRDDSPLVSFNKLDLKSFTLETQPNRLFVNEVDIDSFFVNALIDANKTMNLATLVKGVEDVNASSDSNVTEELVLADANLTQEEVKEPFPVKIMKVNVTNGNAVFADASLPINFKTDIHDLNGAIYSISTAPNETTLIDIVGEVDKYGSTKLKGSMNASNPKAYTDINFNFKNLDLSAMSGYSATFAGYKIDDGKLFLDLNYDIKESQLLGENSIIVKNIKLGETLEVEGGSSLPLGFVIALLEDSEGVIDIDMPIRGNVDEPDFKYGALVWKTLGNLILKAVASPFSFLGSMLGIDGDALKYAEFEAGSLAILPPEREKLDNIAKLLTKRPKMNLSVAGSYNTQVDTLAIQKTKLANRVVKLSGAKNELERINAMTIALLEDIYEDARDDDKIKKIEDTLEEKYDDDEKFQRAYLQALVKECTVLEVVTPLELQELAKKRAHVIGEYLVQEKGINLSRIKELDVLEVPQSDSKLIQSKLEVVVD